MFPFSVTCNLVSAAQREPGFPCPSPPASPEAAPWARDTTPGRRAPSPPVTGRLGAARPRGCAPGGSDAQGETRPGNPRPSVAGLRRDAPGAGVPGDSAPSRCVQAPGQF